MGLFSIFKRKKLKGNVAFVGLGFAGKTTILNRLKNDGFSEDTVRTMGLNVDSFTYSGVNFSTYDLGGQETFRMIWEPYVRQAIAVCFVIDSSAPMLFNESAKVLRNVLQYIPENAILLLLANKSDIAPRDTLHDILNAFDFYKLQETSKLSRINIFYISAKVGGDEFDDAFTWLAENVTEYMKNEKKLQKLAESKNKVQDEAKESLGL